MPTEQSALPRRDAGPAAPGVQSGRSLVRRCQLWANLEEQKVRTAGPSSQGIPELADLRKPTARITFRYRRPQLIEPECREVVGRDQPLHRLASVAAAGGDGLVGAKFRKCCFQRNGRKGSQAQPSVRSVAKFPEFAERRGWRRGRKKLRRTDRPVRDRSGERSVDRRSRARNLLSDQAAKGP